MTWVAFRAVTSQNPVSHQHASLPKLLIQTHHLIKMWVYIRT